MFIYSLAIKDNKSRSKKRFYKHIKRRDFTQQRIMFTYKSCELTLNM